MAGLCEDGNEPTGSLKAICNQRPKTGLDWRRALQALYSVQVCPVWRSSIFVDVRFDTNLEPTSDINKTSLMRQLDQEIMGRVASSFPPSIAYIAD
ncbi:hypothetical protein ANN_19964 [Periplaneta americana]|uniref:Uncharacterized protein n=1 Tax=Periplaneta americana TaxID=6978 RepID=A0ABQ8SBB4_PERAM|nr:hypothetical protein ANN_19964 [Periplaneta americana]